MQRAFGHHRDVGLFDVFAADAREHFAIHRQLTVSPVIRGCPDVDETAHNSEQQDGQRTGENRDFQLRRHGLFIFREETGTPLATASHYRWFDAAKVTKKSNRWYLSGETSRLLESTLAGNLFGEGTSGCRTA